MGKYMKKAKITGDVTVMEVSSSLGVRTRAKTLALQRLQKTTHQEGPKPDTSYLELRSRRLEKPPLLSEPNKKQNPNPKASSRVELGSVNSNSVGSVPPGEKINAVETEDVGVEASYGENVLEFEGRDRYFCFNLFVFQTGFLCFTLFFWCFREVFLFGCWESWGKKMKEGGILFVSKLGFCLFFHIYIFFQFWNKFYAPFGCWECGGAGWGRNEVKSCWLLKWVTLFFHNSFFPFSFSKILCSVWLPRNRKKMKESGILFVSKMGFLCFGLIPLFFSFWQNLFV